jgi:hypothetical protein
MGLDLMFNKKRATKAGLIIKRERNGSQEEVRDALAIGDVGHATWLKKEERIFQVPGCDHFVRCDTIGSDLIVRANPWGRTYKPLTEWLKKHNIEWREYS